MATYSGVADANGDFTVPFSSSYTSGQKVTVTAEKDGAEKSIELYAPSDVSGGGFFQISGTLVNFPLNIGDISITGLMGVIRTNAFSGYSCSIFQEATSLFLGEGPTIIGMQAFYRWGKALKVDLPSTITEIGANAFSDLKECNEITIRAATPPIIASNTFASLKATCAIKVPATSVAAYQAAVNWSAFAARIQAI